MRVIVYINEPGDLQNAQACLKWALSEPTLRNAGAKHYDNKMSFFEKRKSGTVVIHVLAEKETSFSPSPAKESEKV